MAEAGPKSVVAPVDPRRADVAALIKQADDYLLSRYPADLCFLDDATALAQPKVTLLGVFNGGLLVGMGAVKLRADDEDSGKNYGEIKRVFITAEGRGKGWGEQLMHALESELRRQGITTVRLETGIEQPEAIGLYQKLGYGVRGPFGDYPDSEWSIFMEKQLGRP